MTDVDTAPGADDAPAATLDSILDKAGAAADLWESDENAAQDRDDEAREQAEAEAASKAAKAESKSKPSDDGGEDQDKPVKAKDDKPEKKAEKKEDPEEGDRERDEQGRFKAKGDDKATDGAQERDDGGDADKQPSKSTAFPEAPARFSADAKKEWETLPESARAEVHRMERELTKGLEKYRQESERFSDLRDLDDQLRAKGGNVKSVLDGYIQMERLLRSDPDRGLGALFQNLGLDARQWASRVLGQEAPEGGAHDPQSAQTINRLEQHIQRLEQHLSTLPDTMQQRFDQRAQTQQIEQTIEQFATEKDASGNLVRPHFEALADDIARRLESDEALNLQHAYDLSLRAAQENAQRFIPQAQVSTPPASNAAPTPQPDLEAQTRKGSASITGAPDSGSNPDRKRRSSSIEDSLERAGAQTGVW